VNLLDRLKRKVEQAQSAAWDHASLAIRLDPPPFMEDGAGA